MGVSFRAMIEDDLGRLVQAVAGEYPPGTLERLGRVAPGVRAAIEEAEASLGPLYRELLAADRTLARWRKTVAELERLWRLAIQAVESAEALDREEAEGESLLAEVA